MSVRAEALRQVPSFYESNLGNLEELFITLGHAGDWRPDLDKLVEYTQQKWVKGDHWSPENQEVFSESQTEAARTISRNMGLVDEQLPPRGEYDQVIVLGGIMRTNDERVGFVSGLLERDGISITKGGRLLFWGGERLRDEKEDTAVATTFDAIAKKLAPSDPWLIRQQELHVSSAPEQAIRTELDEGRLSLSRWLGSLPLKRAYLSLANSKAAFPKPLVVQYELQHPEFPVSLLNTAAVDRPLGKPRHTTEACAQHWIDRGLASEANRVLFVTNNPYIQRTALVVQNILHANSRANVELVPCGPAAFPDAPVQLFLGEIGRLLYEDQQRLVSIN